MKFNSSADNVLTIVKSLEEIYDFYKGDQPGDSLIIGGDKGTIHSYIPVYSKLFQSKRKNINFLEIGVWYGLSMKMWEEYFIDSNLYGLDITDVYVNKMFPEKNFQLIIGDSREQSTLDHFENIKFDIIIDDGNHSIKSQLETFELFKTKINKNGIYIIEDVSNLDDDIDKLKKLHNNCEIIDNRKLKNRHDDVLAIYRF